jgi:hypothetical protein
VLRLTALLLVLGLAVPAFAYSHVVVVVLENRDYTDIAGNKASAPYINGVLARQGAELTNSVALSEPSQPNYLQLFSGSPQDTLGSNGPVPGSQAPAGAPPTGTGLETPNLGAAVQQAGGTYASYSESLGRDPLAYSAGGASGELYMRKHNPGSNWVAVNPRGNQLAASTNQDFAAFKALSFELLPTLAFVIPNQCNDAHGVELECPYGRYQPNTALADTWLRTNVAAYAQWAVTHDSLLIVTTDEGNSSIGRDPQTGQRLSRVPTFIVGASIAAGSRFAGKVTHYGLCAFIAGAVGARPPGHCGAQDSLAQARALAAAIGAKLAAFP